MGLLGSVAYDPVGAVSKVTDTRTVMTALDTTNLRISFVAPSNGSVLVKIKAPVHGATSMPSILLGVLDGSTVKLRATPFGLYLPALATSMATAEVTGVVTGLTAGTTYTWDAAMSVDVLVASTGLKYGGPNNTTGDDAFGAIIYEIWETPNLLAAKTYDPSSAATAATTSLLAMTALDTTNLRCTFTAPPTGKVFWRLRTLHHGTATYGQMLLGVLDGATVKARVAPLKAWPAVPGTTSRHGLEGSGVITGLTGGSSYSFDAAYGVETVASAGGLKWGGPNDTTTDNAFGAALFDIWSVESASLPFAGPIPF